MLRTIPQPAPFFVFVEQMRRCNFETGIDKGIGFALPDFRYSGRGSTAHSSVIGCNKQDCRCQHPQDDK
jgi:hypothetical protein